jgi:hypothetical protein
LEFNRIVASVVGFLSRFDFDSYEEPNWPVLAFSAVLAYGIAAVVHLLFPSFPTWAAGVIGIVASTVGFFLGIRLDYSAVFAFGIGIAAVIHRLSPSFPIWGAGILGVVSVLFAAYCVWVLNEKAPQRRAAYIKRLLFGWAMVAFGIAALMHWLSPWFSTWAAAGLFGMVVAPIVCPLALLLSRCT